MRLGKKIQALPWQLSPELVSWLRSNYLQARAASSELYWHFRNWLRQARWGLVG
jgi:hypothetical protein